MKVILKDIVMEKGFVVDDSFVDVVIAKNIEVEKGEMTPKKLYANVIATFLEKYVDTKASLSNNMITQVKTMHEKFQITSDNVKVFSEEEKRFRICAMQEELDEYKEAEAREDQLDALIDLVVFALGTAERQGLLEVFEEGFNRVMTANMQKELGQNQKRGSFQLDLVKPKGWVAPEHTDLVYKFELGELFTEISTGHTYEIVGIMNNETYVIANALHMLFDEDSKRKTHQVSRYNLINQYRK